ncbi:MAG: methyltransferase family protein [Longimicrobiales bacterium]
MNPATVIETLAVIAFLAAMPVGIQGFRRRRSGEAYEADVLIQRAPQLVSLANLFVILGAFHVFPNGPLNLFHYLPSLVADLVSWLGVLLCLSGLIFMVGGWYSLGTNFSPDAEILPGQTITNRGLYRVVLHPAYSGIVQALLGAGLTSGSLVAIGCTLGVVAPLWLRRARYEERLLLETFGDRYETYADSMGWRRLVPRFTLRRA